METELSPRTLNLLIILAGFLVLFLLFGFGKSAAQKQEKKITAPSSKRGRHIVQQTQLILMNSGYYPGPVDGLIGPSFRNSLKQFQKKYLAKRSGYLDLPTWELFQKILKLNKEPFQIEQVQRALSHLGFYPGPINGQLDEQSMKAISKFQQWRELKSSGVIDSETWTELKRYIQKNYPKNTKI